MLQQYKTLKKSGFGLLKTEKTVPSENELLAIRLEEALKGNVLAERIFWLDTVDSTNDQVKRLAATSKYKPFSVIADAQSAGRGRRGRSFLSLAGKGLYLSVLLKPDSQPEKISALTAWTAVAVREAIERVCGVCVDIKWPNDLVADGKKLCGILTELLSDADGTVQGVVVGVGLNASQNTEDFGELSESAVSLKQLGCIVPSKFELAKQLLVALDGMARDFPDKWEEYLEQYGKHCASVGRKVVVLRGDEKHQGYAEALGEDFSLLVRYEDGSVENVSAGEVSIRGAGSYTP